MDAGHPLTRVPIALDILVTTTLVFHPASPFAAYRIIGQAQDTPLPVTRQYAKSVLLIGAEVSVP